MNPGSSIACECGTVLEELKFIIFQIALCLVMDGAGGAVEGLLPADEFAGGVVVHGHGEARRRVTVEVRGRQLALRLERPGDGVGPGAVSVLDGRDSAALQKEIFAPFGRT